MFILFSLINILFFSVLFVSFYFAMEKVKSYVVLLKINIFEKFYKLFEGLLYGMFFILVRVITDSMIVDNYIMIFFVGFFALAMAQDELLASYSLLPSVTFYLFMNDITLDFYIFASITFALLLGTIILKFFYANNWIKKITFSSYLLVSTIAFLISFMVIHESYSNKILVIYVFTPIALIWVDFLLNWSIKFSVSANLLYESVNFAFSLFYRQSLKNNAIGTFISKNKVNRGIYGIFKIDIKDVYSNLLKQEVMETVLNRIEKTFPKNSILFKADHDHYGFFLPEFFDDSLSDSISENFGTLRRSSTVIGEIEKNIEKLNSNFMTSENKVINVHVSAGVSIYGLQSSSLDELQRNALFATKYLGRDISNNVVIFDPQEFIGRSQDQHRIKKLEASINLNNFIINFYPVAQKNNFKDLKINVVDIVNVSEVNYVGSIKRYAEQLGIKDDLNRHIAAEALKRLDSNYDGSIAVPYSLNSIWKMKPHNFIKRIRLLNWEPSQIILYVDINKVIFTNEMIDNIKLLRENGMRIAVKNPKLIYRDFVKKINPEFIFISTIDDELILDHPNTIFVNAFVKQEVMKAERAGIKFFSGKLFSAYHSPHKIDKTSKINIRELFGRENS